MVVMVQRHHLWTEVMLMACGARGLLARGRLRPPCQLLSATTRCLPLHAQDVAYEPFSMEAHAEGSKRRTAIFEEQQVCITSGYTGY